MSAFDQAPALLRAGLSVIPVGPDKKPLIQWAPFQRERASEEQLREWAQRYPHANIGIVTGEISGLTVFDFDDQKAVDFFLQNFKGETPCVDTPKGLHAYFRYDGSRNTTKVNGLAIDVRSDGGYVVAPPSVNTEGKMYRWHQSILEVSPAPVPEFLKESFNNSFSFNAHRGDNRTDGADNNRQHLTTNDNIFTGEGTRDDHLFHVANALVKGGCHEQIARKALTILASQCNPPFSPREVQAKIDSAWNRAARRERNLTSDIRDFILTTNGIFSTTDVYNGQHLTTREEKKAAVVILARLAKEGLLEKHGNKNGVYRRVDQTIEYMDFVNADPNDTIDLRLPLDIHKKTKLFPKAVIALGGVSGMGKTLFCLNTIADNMERMPCFYFNSEMSPQQLKAKLSYFLRPMSTFADRMKVIDGWDFNNVADKIQPNALNAIDYLEPEADKPYSIHSVISAIIRRLDRGVALIAIQKRPGSKLATGGIYSIKAASLALALDWGRIEIIKNRNREADKNPTLNTLSFDVKGGYSFSAKGGWYGSD